MATAAGPSRAAHGRHGGDCFDIYELFGHYNALYFHDSLGACTVGWAPDPLPSGTSTCQYFPGGGCDIFLSKSLREYQMSDDLKNALLHEMIHAYMCIREKNTDHSDHGPRFQKLMRSINSNSAADRHRPAAGYNITIYHEVKRTNQQEGLEPAKALEYVHVQASEKPNVTRDLDKRIGISKDSSGSRKPTGDVPGCYSPKKVLSMDISIKSQTDKARPETPKQSSSTPKNINGSMRNKRRRLGNDSNGCTVVIEWLDFVSSEETDQAEEPLLNKRTERRKAEKQVHRMEIEHGGVQVEAALPHVDSINVLEDDDSKGPRDGQQCHGASATENSITVAQAQEATADRSAPTEGEPDASLACIPNDSPLTSPARVEIVEISE